MSRKDLDSLKLVAIEGELWVHDGYNYRFHCEKCKKSEVIIGKLNLDRLHALQRSGCNCGNKFNASLMPIRIEARRRRKLRR